MSIVLYLDCLGIVLVILIPNISSDYGIFIMGLAILILGITVGQVIIGVFCLFYLLIVSFQSILHIHIHFLCFTVSPFPQS